MTNPINFSLPVSYIPIAKTPKTKQEDLSFTAIQEKIRATDKTANPSDNNNSLYNPRNCTFDELCSTIKTLARQGKISMHDVLLTTLDVTRSFRANPNFKYYMTPNDQFGRRNWVDEFGALANREFGRGNTLGYQRHMERKAVLMKVSELLSQ